MISPGFAAFVAMTGLHAGPVFLDAIRNVGPGLFPGGVAVTLVPPLTGLGFGCFGLRMPSALLLGRPAPGSGLSSAVPVQPDQVIEGPPPRPDKDNSQ
jgi:putative transport protein